MTLVVGGFATLRSVAKKIIFVKPTQSDQHKHVPCFQFQCYNQWEASPPLERVEKLSDRVGFRNMHSLDQGDHPHKIWLKSIQRFRRS